MRATTFTPEELDELRRFDAEVDAAPMTYEDWKTLDLVEDLLFPERARQREASRRKYERSRERALSYSKEYSEAHKAEIAARKKAWYIANRERVAAQQKAYQQRKRREAKQSKAGAA